MKLSQCFASILTTSWARRIMDGWCVLGIPLWPRVHQWLDPTIVLMHPPKMVQWPFTTFHPWLRFTNCALDAFKNTVFLHTTSGARQNPQPSLELHLSSLITSSTSAFTTRQLPTQLLPCTEPPRQVVLRVRVEALQGTSLSINQTTAFLPMPLPYWFCRLVSRQCQ